MAQSYLMEARHAYLRWGALAKVAALEAQYPQLCTHTLLTPRGEARPPALMTSNQLDFNTALKAAQAISGEMMLEGLLTKLMRMLLENSGAQRGFLVLGPAEALMIEAEGDLTQSNDIVVNRSCPLETNPNLSAAIVHYVVRLQRSVVLHDVTHEGPFTTDAYVTQYQPQSVLCAPIMHQNHLSGVIYLENNLTTGAFTHERLEVVHLLASQAAIAIENASLYEHVAETNARLEDYNRTLAQKVEERTEELRDKNRELEAANEMILAATERKIQFFSGMSHELRAPLDAVIGFSEVLEEQTFGSLNEQQQEYVNYILTSGNHLLSLINNLLELSKIDAGMMSLQLNPFSLRPLLEGSLLIVREQAAARGIRLTMEIDEQVDRIVGDELRVKQILVNLLNNAVKFTLDQGAVGVRVTREGGRARIAVWDTGVGIAPEDTSRIFDEFQQVGQHRSGQVKGTGLGLALSKKFVELHGGTIGVESTLGQGSTFTFSLMLADTDRT
ncbi:GAF domain-containing sensor histidine kinase [Candidatus Entotheonella palauensis]|uniref:histidine kinase n=1 Tax=Candidatus Entotheonella gemina TaxID=1429439 RepID=W4LT07_9BACT|nr:GAF domain-containing sensor histidine kinase [Candidatus Entotheonella palauensis]ETX00572.1 MAG: hypothetical protein ETSY2_38800 [Candidatus Entotheonella gemina]